MMAPSHKTEPMLTDHQWGLVGFITWRLFDRKYSGMVRMCRPWKVLEFDFCLEKCLIFQSALKIGNFPWKVLENYYLWAWKIMAPENWSVFVFFMHFAQFILINNGDSVISSSNLPSLLIRWSLLIRGSVFPTWGILSLQWHHNGCDGISNHQPHDCLLNRLFRNRWKKTSKLHVTGLCEGNSPVTSEFPAHRASNVENVSIWWRYHGNMVYHVYGKVFHHRIMHLQSTR